MLTSESDPKELIDKLGKVMRMFKWFICEMFQKEIKDGWGDRKESEPNAIVFKFSLSKHPQKCLDIILFAPANYVYVFTRLKDEPSPSLYYDLKGEWNFETCHDSCWRDRIDGILNEYEEYLESMQFISIYQKLKISDGLYKKFRTARAAAFENNKDTLFTIGTEN